MAIGLVAGLAVTAASGGVGVGLCGSDVYGECRSVVRSFALRTGLMVGMVTVVMQVVVAGLLSMVAQEESRRLEMEGVWD